MSSRCTQLLSTVDCETTCCLEVLTVALNLVHNILYHLSIDCVLFCDNHCLLDSQIRTIHFYTIQAVLQQDQGYAAFIRQGNLYSSSRDNEALNSMVSNCIYTPVYFVPVIAVVTSLTCIGFVPVLKQPGPFPKSIMRYYN